MNRAADLDAEEKPAPQPGEAKGETYPTSPRFLGMVAGFAALFVAERLPRRLARGLRARLMRAAARH